MYDYVFIISRVNPCHDAVSVFAPSGLTNDDFIRNTLFIGSYVPNAVYRGSPKNVGFRATAIITSTSEMRATAACLLLHY